MNAHQIFIFDIAVLILLGLIGFAHTISNETERIVVKFGVVITTVVALVLILFRK